MTDRVERIRVSPWVSVSDYAWLYGVDRATVYKWLSVDGILDTYRVGSLRRIRNVPPREISGRACRQALTGENPST